MVNCINLIIEMSPRFVPGRENVSCVAEVVNRSLKADCTDFTLLKVTGIRPMAPVQHRGPSGAKDVKFFDTERN